MKKSTMWFGYLDAGSKSSAVVIDDRLNTGNPDTLYVFNLARGKILEYRRAIAEQKLRELGPNEHGLIDELKMAFEAARRDFQARGAKILNLSAGATPAGTPAARARDQAANDDESEDFDLDLDDADEVDAFDDVDEM